MEKNNQKNYQKNNNVDFEVAENLEKNPNLEKGIYSNNNKKKSDLSQKFIFGTLLFLGVGTLIYSFANLSNTIYGAKNNLTSNTENAQVEQSNVINDLLETQNMDTDKDGLTDYEESYIYKTSPYLPDTDSDGYLDKQEIDGGYDPLCPKGQDCYGTEQTQENINSVNPENPNPETQIQELSAEDKDLLKSLSPTELRQLMLDSGQLTQEELDQIDDATLMQIFSEVINSQ